MAILFACASFEPLFRSSIAVSLSFRCALVSTCTHIFVIFRSIYDRALRINT